MRKSVRYLILVLPVPVTLFVALIAYTSLSDYSSDHHPVSVKIALQPK